jgi:UDP-N-acetylglucosamine--N-acetylmuramyl-(pentapeptide) pyrophosphoryl-undecaprenol N-acetylglucosamine transferase
MKTSKVIVITGSHHTPAIELIHQLREDPTINWTINYFGHIFPRESHIKNTIIPQLNVNFMNIDSGKFDRHNFLTTMAGFSRTIKSLFRCYFILKKIKADIVVSFGGYVSVPVIIASYFCRLPSITHEQTHTISLSTRINSYFTNLVALSFKSTLSNTPISPKKIIVTGNLLRREIFNNHTTTFKSIANNLKKYPLIYVTGGNQGSVFINQLISQLVPELSKKYTVIHQTGSNYIGPSSPNYFPVEFVEAADIGWVLNNCSLIISRSGANICQEIELFKIPRILIPLPDTQQNEQLLNAKWLQQQNQDDTIILNQSNTTPDQLLSSVRQLNNHRQFKLVLPQNQKLLLAKINELSR